MQKQPQNTKKKEPDSDWKQLETVNKDENKTIKFAKKMMILYLIIKAV